MEARTWNIGDHVDFVDLVQSQGMATPSLSDTARWYCIVVGANQHGRVTGALYEAGYRTFTPMKRVWVSHARVRKAVERPLLGRYVFVEIDQPSAGGASHVSGRQSFYAVRQIKGVDAFLVNHKGEPAPFPSAWVEDFLHRYMRGEWDEVADGSLPVGARVRVMEGEFANMLATVVGVKGKRVDVKLFDSTQHARLNESTVRAA